MKKLILILFAFIGIMTASAQETSDKKVFMSLTSISSIKYQLISAR